MNWLSSVDATTSIVANTIAIGVFIRGLIEVPRWATAVRRGLSAEQFNTPNETLKPVAYPHCQIEMRSLSGPGPNDWTILWTEIGGIAREGVATVLSPRLKWHLQWRSKDRTPFKIVGEICYLLPRDSSGVGGSPRFIEITTLDFICDSWFSKFVIGGQWLAALRRTLRFT